MRSLSQHKSATWHAAVFVASAATVAGVKCNAVPATALSSHLGMFENVHCEPVQQPLKHGGVKG